MLERIAAFTDGYKADLCIEVIGSKVTFEQAGCGKIKQAPPLPVLLSCSASHVKGPYVTPLLSD